MNFYFKAHHYRTKQMPKLSFTSTDSNELSILALTDSHTLNTTPVPTSGLQPATIIEWVRQFRSQQILYKQTGATYSAGVLLNSGKLLVIECSSFETSCLKLLGL